MNNPPTNSLNKTPRHKKWLGRFAPSPSGPLHLGSLVAAVASFMIAKQNGGSWLVRIEDLDPPREIAGAADAILSCLDDCALHWDGEVVYQSQRSEIYRQRLRELTKQSIVYQCDCSRKLIEARHHGVYDGYCDARNLLETSDQATRIRFASGFEIFEDKILGRCEFSSANDQHDFIVKRRDGLFAYQLAVVADDIEQGIDHVVRGKDILDSTPRQNFLYQCFGLSPPSYYHLPLVEDSKGIKFSKRSGSEAVVKERASEMLVHAFDHLGQKIDPEMLAAKPDEIITHFLKNWRTDKILSEASQLQRPKNKLVETD